MIRKQITFSHTRKITVTPKQSGNKDDLSNHDTF